MRVLDGGRISIAALSLGIGRGALDAASNTSKSDASSAKPSPNFRASSGSSPTWPPNSTPRACLPIRAAVLKDAGKHVTQESAMAKLYAGEVAVQHLQRSRPAPRRLRLHQGLSRRKVLPRRQALHHRRRHQRNSENGHRPRDPQSPPIKRIRKSCHPEEFATANRERPCGCFRLSSAHRPAGF